MIEHKMRRFAQALPQEEVMRILNEGKVAVWALGGDDGYPYAVPVNYVYCNGYIYIHSATAGHKIDAVNNNPLCSICIIDKDDVVPQKFTSYYRSIIAFGRAQIITCEDEIIMALRSLCNKYCMGFDPTDEINKFLKSILIIRIQIEKLTGKEAIELVRQRNK